MILENTPSNRRVPGNNETKQTLFEPKLFVGEIEEKNIFTHPQAAESAILQLTALYCHCCMRAHMTAADWTDLNSRPQGRSVSSHFSSEPHFSAPPTAVPVLSTGSCRCPFFHLPFSRRSRWPARGGRNGTHSTFSSSR
jgi:hypothetical protein